jgi:phosphatidate cytidylyltransferase
LGAHVLLMRALPSVGAEATLLFGAIFVSDATLAAAGTRLFGRHKLARRVSDTRTWEGAALGLVAAVVAGVLVARQLSMPFSTVSAAALAAFVAILATVGDLGASAVKRSAGLGERAGWVPGLGEIFNATDGVLLSAPFFYWSFRTLVL